MTTITVTRDWSDAIEVTETTRIVSIDDRIGVSRGATLPAADYIGHPLVAGESTDISAGSFRLRSLTAKSVRVNYQPWTI